MVHIKRPHSNKVISTFGHSVCYSFPTVNFTQKQAKCASRQKKTAAVGYVTGPLLAATT
jgi:hypothetical protein